MGVSSGRSRVADLAFRVFNRALHPEWLTTRVFRRVEQSGWEADLRVIEGGHAVIFHAGSIRMTEILAGPETALPEPGLLYHSPVRYERSALLRPGGSVEYQSCFEVEHVDAEVFRHLCEEATLDALRDSLFHRFHATNRLAPPPISLIQLTPRARDLSIHSFHTFPEECAIVRTQSLFELKRSP
jgi:Protein of unknown function DUF2617